MLGLFLFLLCLGLFKGEDRTVLIYLGSLAAVINGENACRLICLLGNGSELRLFIGGDIVAEHILKSVVGILHYLVQIVQRGSVLFLALYVDYPYHLEHYYNKAGDNDYQHYSESRSYKAQH